MKATIPGKYWVWTTVIVVVVALTGLLSSQRSTDQQLLAKSRLPMRISILMNYDWLNDDELLYWSGVPSSGFFRVNPLTGSGTNFILVETKQFGGAPQNQLGIPWPNAYWTLSPDKKYIWASIADANARGANRDMLIETGTERTSQLGLRQGSWPAARLWSRESGQWLEVYRKNQRMYAELLSSTTVGVWNKAELGSNFFDLYFGVGKGGELLAVAEHSLVPTNSITLLNWNLRSSNSVPAQTRVSLPQNGQVVSATLSPNGEKIAWVLAKESRLPRVMLQSSRPFMVLGKRRAESLWISSTTGLDWKHLGTIRTGDSFRVLRWKPNGKSLSFITSGGLYVVRAFQ